MNPMDDPDTLRPRDPQAALRRQWRRQAQALNEALARVSSAQAADLALLPEIDKELFAGLTCGARSKRTGNPCRLVALCAGGRCRFHGGLSTGPKTAEGKARALAACAAGRERAASAARLAKVA